jgi:hypothetical protein
MEEPDRESERSGDIGGSMSLQLDRQRSLSELYDVKLP